MPLNGKKFLNEGNSLFSLIDVFLGGILVNGLKIEGRDDTCL